MSGAYVLYAGFDWKLSVVRLLWWALYTIYHKIEKYMYGYTCVYMYMY